MTIHILDSKTISQIAAGEVVERPASVVKELLENSLDAGARQITIVTRRGGISLIEVADDGSGIPGNEIELAFERHATSKITSLADLSRIATLGFRGEALPSIASVAEVEMLSRTRDEISGTRLRLVDGRIVQKESAARSQGTTVTVHDLFRRVPARLKFLKSEATENNRIAEVVSRYALAYPEVKFTLIVDTRTLMQTPGNGKLHDAISAVYGLEIASNLLEIHQDSFALPSTGESSLRVSGYISKPEITRSTRENLIFLVNRRWVSNRLLSIAVEEAYHGLLMQGKHPLAIINLTIPPEMIDVNVHPTKTEIKFQDEKLVFAVLQKAVRQSLIKSAPVPEMQEIHQKFTIPATPLQMPADFAHTNLLVKSGSLEKPLRPTPLISLPLLRVIGQYACNYIVAEGPDSLFLIDQHAAHERIQYEKLKHHFSSATVEVQGLLEPVPFDLEPGQATLLEMHLSELRTAGFWLEFFGERTCLVRTIPAMLKESDWKSVLKEILENSTSNWQEQMITTIACHGAIRAGQPLSDGEMREMIRQLEQTALPNTCPHGRPTLIQISRQKLEREFGRT